MFRGVHTRMLNNVSRPEAYEEVIIENKQKPIALSIWKAEKTNPCIVFIPGTMTHPLAYEEFLNLLSLSGFNIIGIHLLCHGKSPRVAKTFRIEDFVDNIISAITYTIDNFNTKIFLMGSSQGGILTQLVAGIDRRITAAFPHCISLPKLKESISITKFPNWLASYQDNFVSLINIIAKIFPTLPIPLSFYLDVEKAFKDKKAYFAFCADPLVRNSYPLEFIASLLSADMSYSCNGSITCPMVVFIAKDDPVFTLDYTKKVFELIKAPYKELVILDSRQHSVFTHSLNEVAQPVIAKLEEYV